MKLPRKLQDDDWLKIRDAELNDALYHWKKARNVYIEVALNGAEWAFCPVGCCGRLIPDNQGLENLRRLMEEGIYTFELIKP